MADAARRLIGAELPQPVARRARVELEEANQSSGRWAEKVWKESKPAAGTLAERYFASRGISGPTLNMALRRLRFLPRAFHSSTPETGARFAPAIVARVTTPDGPTLGVHLTYLDPHTGEKSSLRPAKKMVGPQTLNGIRGGCWLTSVTAKGPLIVGEGIESALSAAQLVAKGPCRVVATLSLGALQGGVLLDTYGRIDPDLIRPDPDKPPFTWPEPEVMPWGEVLIAVDRDMSPLPVKVRKMGGGTIERRLTADDRARICASLAINAWKKAGAAKVRSVAPGAGRDFNDELRGV
jgi:hypothetical protein